MDVQFPNMATLLWAQGQSDGLWDSCNDQVIHTCNVVQMAVVSGSRVGRSSRLCSWQVHCMLRLQAT